MTDHPVLFSAPMVLALLAGTKTQTRRLATSPLRRCKVGDRLYVREHWKTNVGNDGVPPRNLDVETSILMLADNVVPTRRFNAPWGKHRQAMHMPRWASRLTLIVEAVRVEPLRDIIMADVLAEGAPLDPHHRDCTQDRSNPVMCIGETPWTTQSPHAWYHRLWDSLHTAAGETWDDNPDVLALSFRVQRGNIDRLTPPAGPPA